MSTFTSQLHPPVPLCVCSLIFFPSRTRIRIGRYLTKSFYQLFSAPFLAPLLIYATLPLCSSLANPLLDGCLFFFFLLLLFDLISFFSFFAARSSLFFSVPLWNRKFTSLLCYCGGCKRLGLSVYLQYMIPSLRSPIALVSSSPLLFMQATIRPVS